MGKLRKGTFMGSNRMHPVLKTKSMTNQSDTYIKLKSCAQLVNALLATHIEFKQESLCGMQLRKDFSLAGKPCQGKTASKFSFVLLQFDAYLLVSV